MPPAELVPVDFAALQGWTADNHAAAFAAFRLSAARAVPHPPKTRALGVDGAALVAVAQRALALSPLDADAARAFFEQHFVPCRVAADGFFTGFYEPEVEARLRPEPGFTVPLMRPPPELVEIDETEPPPAGLPSGTRFARRSADGFAPFFDRGAIERGALAGRGLEIAFVADPVDAFFIHIQGAARLRLADGTLMRVTYAAKSGHDYTPVGRVLLEQGVLQRGNVSMQTIRAALAADPAAGREAMWRNRSYIFFREAAVADPALGPVAAAKVPLTAGRSLAVDRTLHTFHAPVWIDTRLPEAEGGEAFRRLMVAQDTGSAILGPARGDIFFGSGEDAGRVAGRMAAGGGFVVLVPRGPV